MTNESGLEFEHCKECGTLLHSDKFLESIASEAGIKLEDTIVINRDLTTQILGVLQGIIAQESIMNSPYMPQLEKDALRLKLTLEELLNATTYN